MKKTTIVFPSSMMLMMALLQGCNDDKNKDDQPTQPSQNQTVKGSSATVALLETTDLHNNILSYDYFKLAEDKSVGLERTARLIAEARQQFPNNVLLDNGDTIQGTALSDYQATVNPIKCDQTLAIYKVMNQLKFDGSGIGNHEFNYGLPFLNQVTNSKFDVDGIANPSAQPNCAGPNFPQVLANIYSAKTKQPLFKPYKIITKTISAKTPDGKTVTSTLKIGIIGFTPPQILNWDKRWLEGKVYTVGMKEAAEEFIPKMKAEGADLIVVISHGGLDSRAYSPTMENGSYYLSKVKDVDAMLIGHSHDTFPNPASTSAQFDLEGVDKVKGLVNGIPTVMSSFWGKVLGVIQLNLTYDGSKWVVDKNKTLVEARSTQKADKSYIEVDPSIAKAIDVEHQATIQYVKTPIGTTDFNMTSYFADVGDATAIEIVNQAQTDYIRNYVQANLPQYAQLPVLSVSAPFKSGFAGGTDFTDVAAGNLAINNAADLYLYPNNVYAVKATGTDIKNWLETSAKRFNQIDPNKTTAQNLISTFPGYNFDMFTSADIHYEIDVTQPVNSRIKNLKYKGSAINPTQEFIVVTNNYRASGGGNFPGLDGTKTIYASPDTNRDALIEYIKKTKNINRMSHGSHRSWNFSPVSTSGDVIFKSAQNKLAYAQQAGLNNISIYQADEGSGKGLSIYKIDLAKAQ